jgi:hypothetical protein
MQPLQISQIKKGRRTTARKVVHRCFLLCSAWAWCQLWTLIDEIQGLTTFSRQLKSKPYIFIARIIPSSINPKPKLHSKIARIAQPRTQTFREKGAHAAPNGILKELWNDARRKLRTIGSEAGPPGRCRWGWSGRTARRSSCAHPIHKRINSDAINPGTHKHKQRTTATTPISLSNRMPASTWEMGAAWAWGRWRLARCAATSPAVAAPPAPCAPAPPPPSPPPRFAG